MRKVGLTMEELDKYNIICNVIHGKCSKNRAEALLGVTGRTINRLVIKYKQDGKGGFKHKNRDKNNPKINILIKDRIIKLYIELYYDFNFTHFTEKSNEHHNIKVSVTFVATLLKEELIISPQAHRVTKRNLKSIIKKQEKKVL